MRAEERCGDAVAGNARAGKCAVIDLPVAARGAALLEQGGRAAEALRKGEANREETMNKMAPGMGGMGGLF